MTGTRNVWCFFFALLLSACQVITPSPAVRPTPTVVPLPEQDRTELVETPALASPTAAASQPAVTGEDPAVKTVRGYFTALEQGNFRAAAELYSSFSLMMAGMTREEAAVDLQGQMARNSRWSGLEVKETRPFGERTVLVHVTYRLEREDPATGQAAQTQPDEWWPVRLENGRWLYNRDHLIDYRMIDVPAQATGGLVVKPLQILRYSECIRLKLMVQNTTNEAIVLGQANEILALFTFKDQQVEAVKKQMVFDRLRTNPDVTLEVMGLYETYPDSVIIRQWKNYNVKPWFSFQLSE
jgi:hypothetical protein